MLGPIEILFQGDPLKISRRLERVMLYYLAGEHRPISRTELIDILWPHAQQTDPRRALRTALSRLRRQLPDLELIKTELDKVWLDTEHCYIDLLMFEQRSKRILNILDAYHNNRSLPAQIAQQLEETVSLWHGEGFILGEDLSAYPELVLWRQTQNNTLEHYRRSLIYRLGEHNRAAGHPEMALSYFMQIVQGDLLNVNLHLAILDILTQIGRHQEVVDYCDNLEEAYDREYQISLPDPILTRYQYAQIQINLNQNLPARDWPIPLTMQLQMVGRAEELTELRNAFFQGGVVVIKGELGCGKTRLVQELYHTLTPKPLLLAAPSYKFENPLPLSPIIHCLRHQLPEDVLEEIDPIWLDQMALLLPELKEKQGIGQLDRPALTPSGQQNLFEALLQVCSSAVRKYGRILLYLDDAQWVDSQTLQALSYFALHGFFGKNAVLVIAYSTKEPNPNLEAMIDQIRGTCSLQIIQISHLTPDEIAALVQQVVGKPLPSAMIDRLFIETNGNPLFTLEIIRSLLDQPQQLERYQASDPFPLPESIQAIFRRRLSQLYVEERHILLCAAVLGDSFSAQLLKAIAQQDKTSDQSFLDPLIIAGFINTSPGNKPSDMFHFAHAKMHEFVLKEAIPIQKQTIHRLVARHLVKEQQAKQNAGVIADHFLKGGRIKDAFDWYLISAESAWIVAAKEEAQRAYQQAEKLYLNAHDGTFDIFDASRLYQQWGEFAYQSIQIDILEETGTKLQYLGEKEQIPRLIGISKIALANACLLRRDIDTGLKVIQEALNQINFKDNPLTYIRAKLREGSLFWLKFDIDQAEQAAETAINLIEKTESDSPDLTSLGFYARYVFTMCLYAKGEGTTALSYLQETNDIFTDQLNPFDLMRIYYLFSYIHLLMANYEECIDYSLQGYKIAESMAHDYTAEICLVHLSNANFFQGHLDEAYGFAAEALKMGEKNNHRHIVAFANCALGDIYGALDNFVLAAKHYRVAQLRLGFTETTITQLDSDLRLANLFIWHQNLKEAKPLLSPVLEITKQVDAKHLLSQGLILSGNCDLIEGSDGLAETKFDQALEIAQSNGLKYQILWCKLQKAQLAISHGKLTSAGEILIEIQDNEHNFNVAWFKLYAMGMCAKIQRQSNLTIIPNLQISFSTFANKIEAHTQSPPLSEMFLKARQHWWEGINSL